VTVRAVYQQEFGGPEVLQVGELPDPATGPDGVVVRVRAAGVNPVDYKITAGKLQGAYPWAFPLVPGWDAAGVVEQVGPSVTEFAPGDEVIGYVRKDHVQHGTYAEPVTAYPRHLARKPASVSFERAAGLPLAGLTAHQTLDAAGVGEGDVVLVLNASGGVGSHAVQLAVGRGARVLGTASERSAEYVRSLGAEPVPYGEGLATGVADAAGGRVDAVVDFIGGAGLALALELVKDPARIASVTEAATVRGFGGRYVFVRPDPVMLAALAEMVDAGRLRTDVERTFPLEQAADAQRLLAQGHVRGKLVLTA
jgi:NADPH:quinone reductase-like Zn-dependent oxidoreductase